MFIIYTSIELCLNADKTNKVIFSHREISDLENPQSLKFFGVYLDPKFNWSSHIEHISNKISKNIYALHKLVNIVPDEVLSSAYYSLIMSHVPYALICWGRSPFAKRIFGVQRKAVRVITSASYREDVRN